MNRISIICLGVRDMKRSLRFYKSIGFETFEEGDNPPIVFFNNQGSKLELYPIQGLAEDIDADNPPAASPGVFCGITIACNVQSQGEVDKLLALAEQQGGTVVKQAQQVFWGGYSGYFRDPDGYYWEVAYGPDFKYDENGMLLLEDGQ